MGIEGLADTLQNAIDSLLNGPNMLTQNSVPKENGTIPDPINLNQSAQEQTSSNPLDNIMNTFGNIFGGGNGGGGVNLSETIASLGTKFTSAMQNSNQKNQAINTAKQQEAAKKKQTLEVGTDEMKKFNKYLMILKIMNLFNKML